MCIVAFRLGSTVLEFRAESLSIWIHLADLDTGMETGGCLESKQNTSWLLRMA